MKKLVLLSGGIDSSTCLAVALNDTAPSNVVALSMFYGQKHDKELQAARDVARYYGVELLEADLSQAFRLSDSPLLQGRRDIKHQSYAEQLQELGGTGTVDTYVPFRNGLFLSFAAATAISIGASKIFYGAHADDAAGRAYPDCTPEFEFAMNEAIYHGSGYKVCLVAPLIGMNKIEIVALGKKLGVPYQLTWSCYEGGATPCGTCGTCIDRVAALAANGYQHL